MARRANWFLNAAKLEIDIMVGADFANQLDFQRYKFLRGGRRYTSAAYLDTQSQRAKNFQPA
ncbi:UNVERIFIED_CONTAM: hypothetical protein ACS92_07015 [Bacillus cereus]